MVAASLMAATPLEVSGDFKAGYELTFKPNGVKALDATEAQANAVVVSGDFWEMEFGTITFTGDNDDTGTLTVFLDKALAEQGIDMGDVSLKYAIGNMGTMKPSDVYSDSNDAVKELEMNGTYSSKVTLGYTDMVTVEFGASFADFDTANNPIVIGAKFVPIDGVSAAVGYTNYATYKDAADVAQTAPKGGVTGSVLVDVAALADLDFGLSVSAIDVYYIEETTISTDALNNLYAEVKASFGDITAWVEYQNVFAKNNVIGKVSYSGIENVGLYGKLTLGDLSGTLETTIGAGASYKMGGVTYALDATYVVDGTVTLKPSVAVSF
jgi:hypothetical protein